MHRALNELRQQPAAEYRGDVLANYVTYLDVPEHRKESH
jgi:hypothetical protein